MLSVAYFYFYAENHFAECHGISNFPLELVFFGEADEDSKQREKRSLAAFPVNTAEWAPL